MYQSHESTKSKMHKPAVETKLIQIDHRLQSRHIHRGKEWDINVEIGSDCETHSREYCHVEPSQSRLAAPSNVAMRRHVKHGQEHDHPRLQQLHVQNRCQFQHLDGGCHNVT